MTQLQFFPSSQLNVASPLIQALQLKGAMLQQRKAEKQTLVDQLGGEYLTAQNPEAKQSALMNLQRISPAGATNLQSQEIGLQKGRSELAQSQLTQRKTGAEVSNIERDQQLNAAMGLLGVIDEISQNPNNARKIAADAAAYGLLPPESVDNIGRLQPDELGPTLQKRREETVRAIEALKHGSKSLSPVGVDTAAEGFTPGTQEFQNRYTERLDMRARRAPTSVNQAPPGLKFREGQRPNAYETKKAQEIGSSYGSLLNGIDKLHDLVGGVSPEEAQRRGIQPQKGIGTEFIGNDKTTAATMATLLQLGIKDAKALGTLDKGSETFMQRIIDSDPTQLRTDKVLAQLKAARASLRDERDIKLKYHRYEADDASSPTANPVLAPEKVDDFIQGMMDRGLSDEDIAGALRGLGVQQ